MHLPISTNDKIVLIFGLCNRYHTLSSTTATMDTIIPIIEVY